ncbi:MAG TPA: hypothetical protein VF257_10005, partial [Solirubrobacteraceae bacterium]
MSDCGRGGGESPGGVSDSGASGSESAGGAGHPGACGQCLARTWLVARLAGCIEIARHQRRRLREILALSDEKLIAAVGGPRASAIADELERLDVDAL